MKKILAIISAAVLVLSMSGCSKTVKKTVTLTNESGYPLDAAILSTSENVFDADNNIVFFDASADGSYMPALSAADYTFEIPAELADAEWFLYVSAIDNNQLGAINTTELVGNVFSEANEVSEYQNEVYGFSFEYVDEIKNFEVHTLTFKSLLNGDGKTETLSTNLPGTLSPVKPGSETADVTDTQANDTDAPDTADTDENN